MSQTLNKRRPIHIEGASNHAGYEVIWEVIRRVKQFTADDLIVAICNNRVKNNVKDDTVKDYVRRLHKGQYLEVAKVSDAKGNRRTHHYVLVNDVGVEAPRLKKNGEPVTQGLGRANMWRTMRILPSFDYKELAYNASNNSVTVKPTEAKDYIKHLFAAGYLACVKECIRGRHPVPARYRLIPSKNTGPKAPQIQRLKQVYDPNLNEVMHREAGGACEL